jgi:rhamnosyl/mannosyltransferase
MNILHLYKDYFPVLGGIENHLKVVAEAQAAAGHQVTALVCNPGRRTLVEKVNGVEIIKAGRLTTAASMPLSLAQPWRLARSRPDVIHIHSPYPLGEAANWLLGRAKATVITHHSDIVRQRTLLRFYSPMLRRVLQAADRIIATSPRYIESSPWLHPVREKCRVVPLGVDPARFSPADRTQAGPLQLLFVGRLRYYKGLDTLLQALPQAPEVRLTIVGTGPMQAEWDQLSHALGLAKRVTFAGEIDDADLPAWYRQADLFVLPANARSEAFGMVLLEAMASGLPCITTELGTGTSWIVQDGVTGLVVPPADPPALAQAINTLVHNESLRRQFGQAALARVRAEFSQEVMIGKIMHLYQELLESVALRRR